MFRGLTNKFTQEYDVSNYRIFHSGICRSLLVLVVDVPSSTFDASRKLRIKDPGAIHFGKGREDMYLGASWANDLLATDSANQQRIGDQRAMTAPWQRFGAHYCYPVKGHTPR